MTGRQRGAGSEKQSEVLLSPLLPELQFSRASGGPHMDWSFNSTLPGGRAVGDPPPSLRPLSVNIVSSHRVTVSVDCSPVHHVGEFGQGESWRKRGVGRGRASGESVGSPTWG